jgi:PAS domain-containing protein
VAYGRQAILLYNDAFRQIIDAHHPQAFGRSALEIFAEHRPRFEKRLEHVFAGGTITLTNQPFPIFSEGELRKGWCSLTYGPLRNEQGEVSGVFATIFETTAQNNAEASLRKSEARQAFLIHLNDALRQLSDPIEVQAVASRVLGEHLNAIRVHYSEVANEKDCDYYVIRQDYHVPNAASHVGRYRPSDFGVTLFNEIRARHSVVVCDVAVDPMLTAEERAAYPATGVRAYICVPLIKQGRHVAFMSVHQSTPRVWTADDIAMVEETVERTWEAVERARAETALRESETRLRMLVGELNHRVKNTLATVQ